MLTVIFWRLAAERATKTAAQSVLSLWLVGDVTLNALEINYTLALGVALGGALLSLLTSVASAQVGPTNSPSLVKASER